MIEISDLTKSDARLYVYPGSCLQLVRDDRSSISNVFLHQPAIESAPISIVLSFRNCAWWKRMYARQSNKVTKKLDSPNKTLVKIRDLIFLECKLTVSSGEFGITQMTERSEIVLLKVSDKEYRSITQQIKSWQK